MRRLALLGFVASAGLLLPFSPLEIDEALLRPEENAYNPIPNPNGKSIAYVRTGWGRPSGSGGLGRSNLISYIALMSADGKVTTGKPLADGFLADWTPDGSALICYRDWKYWLLSPDGRKFQEGSTDGPHPRHMQPERVTYVNGSFLWADISCSEDSSGDQLGSLELHRPGSVIATKSVKCGGGEMLPVASPNGRYVAVVGGLPQYARPAGGALLVYDFQEKTWADLGAVVVHPDASWNYIKSSWNPWFKDSSHLVYIAGDSLMMSTPDGHDQRKLLRLGASAGLATPSPDGGSIAFATFESRPMKIRPDLRFWGDATMFVVGVRGERLRPVTNKSVDTTYNLRWLDTRTLVFDRISEQVQYQHSRLWKAKVAD